MTPVPRYYMSPEGIAAVNVAGKKLVATWRAQRAKGHIHLIKVELSSVWRDLIALRTEAKQKGYTNIAWLLKEGMNRAFNPDMKVQDIRVMLEHVRDNARSAIDMRDKLETLYMRQSATSLININHTYGKMGSTVQAQLEQLKRYENLPSLNLQQFGRAKRTPADCAEQNARVAMRVLNDLLKGDRK